MRRYRRADAPTLPFRPWGLAGAALLGGSLIIGLAWAPRAWQRALAPADASGADCGPDRPSPVTAEAKPALRDPSLRNPGSRDPSPRDRDPRVADARDPGPRDPDPRVADARDPGPRDPGSRDPDPRRRDPDPRDSDQRDLAFRDPAPRDPAPPREAPPASSRLLAWRFLENEDAVIARACARDAEALLEREPLEFAEGSAELPGHAGPVLQALADRVLGCSGEVLVGVAPREGSTPAERLRLARRRAEAVADALAHRGLDRARLRAAAEPVGSSGPLVRVRFGPELAP